MHFPLGEVVYETDPWLGMNTKKVKYVIHIAKKDIHLYKCLHLC